MSITLDQVTKRYQGSPVVNDVSLEVGEGEFYVLLGPSGSGKSTLLRAIAGLTGVDHGRIALHGNDVTHVSARQRGVGLVFQNYALFRHMTVGENIEFALKVRRMKSAERRERRKELLRLVALEGMDDRLPTQLSGGQQQRVAVARALAHKPPVLLLDEPFGALDAKIREELRRTIRQVQRELKITTVLVTHDQEEAFALADRIGVMNLGRLLESGKPDELYARPATRFVATFLGAANLLLARQTEQGIRFGATPVNARRVEKLEGGSRAGSRRGAATGRSGARADPRQSANQLHRQRHRRRDGLHGRTGTDARAYVRWSSQRADRSDQFERQRCSRCIAGRHAHSARTASLPLAARPNRGDRRAPHSCAADTAVQLHRLRHR